MTHKKIASFLLWNVQLPLLFLGMIFNIIFLTQLSFIIGITNIIIWILAFTDKTDEEYERTRTTRSE